MANKRTISIFILRKVSTFNFDPNNAPYTGLYIRAGNWQSSPASLPGFATYFHRFMFIRSHNLLLFPKLQLLKNLKKTLITSINKGKLKCLSKQHFFRQQYVRPLILVITYSFLTKAVPQKRKTVCNTHQCYAMFQQQRGCMNTHVCAFPSVMMTTFSFNQAAVKHHHPQYLLTLSCTLLHFCKTFHKTAK